MADALWLPMIAYRGLWDKFAAPSTPEAICRAYRRGVASLVRCADETDATGALDALSTTDFNRARLPIVLVVNAPPAIAVPHVPADVSSDVLAIDVSVPLDRVYPVQQWFDGVWAPIGFYISITAYLRGLTAVDLTVADRDHAVVLFESTNVVDDVRTSPLPESLNDDAIYASVRTLAGATAEVFRVSDLVELDWLQQRIREAA